MNLKDFQNFIEPKIVSRGFHYFEAEAITEIEQVDKGEFSATIEGSEDYNVFLKIDKNLNILDHSCDCPYDWGNVCKHEVALMYYVKKNKPYNQSLEQGVFYQLKVDLEGLSKQELIQLLLDLSKKNQIIRKELKEELGYD